MKGVLLLGRDNVIESRAKRHKTALQRSDAVELPFEKTLITMPGTRVPWALLPAAWALLESWDAAVPLWRYDVTAASLGTPEERATTQAVIRDLRVLLHSYELLFIRRNEAGEALIVAWGEECADGGDKRLAFLRAIYRVKPRVCILPTSWLVVAYQSITPASHNRKAPLVTVELEPGRLVKCYAGDEERVREHFRRQKENRHGTFK